jgi:hypothetical protein
MGKPPKGWRKRNFLPGPKHAPVALPPPPEAGVMPPEDSRLWLFTPKSIQQGEAFIQDDTREWFEDRGRKVQIRRDYPDHPRWVLNGGMRGVTHNGNLVSEVHLLARISAGMSEYPEWVPARMTLKQQQADLAFRLTKSARMAFLQTGNDAMRMFAQKAPGQFVKFIAATFIPRKIETELTVPDGQLDTETADILIEKLAEELKRREVETKVINSTYTLDYDPPVNIVDSVNLYAQAIDEANHETAPFKGKNFDLDTTRKLKRVVDVLTPQDQEEWD